MHALARATGLTRLHIGNTQRVACLACNLTEALVASITALTCLSTLHVTGCNTAATNTRLADSLASLRELRSLRFDVPLPHPKVFSVLGSSLASMKSLQRVDVSGSYANASAMAALLCGLRACTSLQELHLQHNRVNREAAAELAELALCNQGLRVLLIQQKQLLFEKVEFTSLERDDVAVLKLKVALAHLPQRVQCDVPWLFKVDGKSICLPAVPESWDV